MKIILRPNGDYSIDEGMSEEPDYGYYYQKIDESTADDTDYICFHRSSSTLPGASALFYYPTFTPPDGVINKVTFFVRRWQTDKAVLYIKNWHPSSGRFHVEVPKGGESFALAQVVTTTNPDSGNPWTWDQILHLNTGIYIYCDDTGEEARVSQFWIEVDYSPIKTLTTDSFIITHSIELYPQFGGIIFNHYILPQLLIDNRGNIIDGIDFTTGLHNIWHRRYE